MKNSRGQGVIEFVVIIGVLLFFLVVFFVMIQGNIEERNARKEQIIAQNIALNVQTEIGLASKSSEGYSRNFSTPLNILGRDYEISLIGSRVYIVVGDFGISSKILEVNGSINKGANIIRKENGSVILN